MKKLINSYKNYINRTKYYNYIQKHDLDINKRICNSDNSLQKNGYEIFKKKIPINLLKTLNSFFNEQQKYNLDYFFEILQFVDNNFSKKINEYFNDDIIICSASFLETKIEKSKDNISNSWHTDNLGHKINLLICVEGDGSQPTLFLSESHKNLYKPKLFEEFRIFKKNISHKKNSIHFKHQIGDCTLFDANGQHRGSYENGSMTRRLMIIDFMKKSKFKDLSYNNLSLSNKKIKLPYRIEKKKIQPENIIQKDVYEKLKKISFIHDENFYLQNNDIYCLFI